MQTILLRRTRTFGLLPLITASLTACGASSDPAPEQSAASEAKFDTPATTIATPVAVENATVREDPGAASNDVPAYSPKPATAPVKPKTGAASPTPARPAPAPSPYTTNDPHAGHDMTGMSDEDTNAMGHD